MKKLILLLAMFFIIYSYSQQRNENYIFGYRLEYFSDSTNLNVKKAEDFEQEYLSLSKKIIDLKNKVEHIKDVEHIKSELNSLVEEIKANV